MSPSIQRQLFLAKYTHVKGQPIRKKNFKESKRLSYYEPKHNLMR